jgi:hypothetical protein
MGKYSALQATAYNLLAAKGGDIVLTRTGAVKGYDPVTRANAKRRSVERFKGVGMPLAQPVVYSNGTLSQENSLEFTMAHKTTPIIEPRPGDTIDWAGYKWTVRSVKPVNPAADGAVIYTVYGER